MNSKIKNSIAISLIPQIILVKWLGSYPGIIEKHYSNGFYPIIAEFSRSLFGRIPFSVGDIIYISLLFLLFRFLILNYKNIKAQPKSFFRNTIMVLAIFYFSFHLLWGLNYYRKPISETLKIQKEHTKEELITFVEELIIKTNNVHYNITNDSTQIVEIPYSKKEIYNLTINGYSNLEEKIPFLTYKKPSLKNSVFSTLLTYMGYGGYLNPFTNEAQVNSKLPNFRSPVVAGHEVGHQIGYSAENETNLIGYIVTANNPDIYFKYTAYAYALSYCLSKIKKQDEFIFEELYCKLNVGIKKNYQDVSNFWEAHKNPLEPVFKTIFSTFLKANNQKDGIKSYRGVVSLLVNYHKKYPL